MWPMRSNECKLQPPLGRQWGMLLAIWSTCAMRCSEVPWRQQLDASGTSNFDIWSEVHFVRSAFVLKLAEREAGVVFSCAFHSTSFNPWLIQNTDSLLNQNASIVHQHMRCLTILNWWICSAQRLQGLPGRPNDQHVLADASPGAHESVATGGGSSRLGGNRWIPRGKSWKPGGATMDTSGYLMKMNEVVSMNYQEPYIYIYTILTYLYTVWVIKSQKLTLHATQCVNMPSQRQADFHRLGFTPSPGGKPCLIPLEFFGFEDRV